MIHIVEFYYIQLDIIEKTYIYTFNNKIVLLLVNF